MADFPNVVVSNGSGVSLQANIAVVTIGSGASSDAGVNYVYDANPVVAGTSYTATVEAKRLAGSTNFRLELKWRKPDGSHLDITTGPTGPTTVGATGTLSVTGTAPSGVGKAILCVRYAAAPASGESFQTANPGITANPNSPTGNSARRLALLGIETGKSSGLPFNSGVNPAGRSGSFPGYEGIQDQVETARGRAFDVRNAFQYNNRNLSEGSTAWNDLRGMQVLDWFDPQAPAVLGMPPFPGGGSWSDAASGAYDAQYVAIGQAIAQKRPSGTAKVVLRLAWEFNGVNSDGSGWYPHVGVNTNGTPRTGFIAGFRQAVTKIRQGAGDRVSIAWSVAASTSSQSTLEALYPGDDYVDIIGVDTYDAFTPSPGGIHSESVWLSSSGIGNLLTFAKAHGKLLALDEWGGHATGSYNDGGDNADFPRIVVNWLKNNADYLAYEAQFNATEAGNVVNNLWATGGTAVQLPNQRAAYISAYAAL